MRFGIFQILTVLLAAVTLGSADDVPDNQPKERQLDLPGLDDPGLSSFKDLLDILFPRPTPCKFPPDPQELEAKKGLNISGLEPECAKNIWCRYNNFKRQDWSNNTWHANLYWNVTRKQAETLFDSPELNGTLFNDNEDMMWHPTSWGRSYSGKWNYSQVCYLQKRPEV
jgi:hypothetical protein